MHQRDDYVTAYPILATHWGPPFSDPDEPPISLEPTESDETETVVCPHISTLPDRWRDESSQAQEMFEEAGVEVTFI